MLLYIAVYCSVCVLFCNLFVVLIDCYQFLVNKRGTYLQIQTSLSSQSIALVLTTDREQPRDKNTELRKNSATHSNRPQ